MKDLPRDRKAEAYIDVFDYIVLISIFHSSAIFRHYTSTYLHRKLNNTHTPKANGEHKESKKVTHSISFSVVFTAQNDT